MKLLNPLTLTLLAAFLNAGFSREASAAVIVSDPVDTYNANFVGGWSRVSGSWSADGNIITPSQWSLSPTEGTDFWSDGNTTGVAANRGTARYFSGQTLQEGVYTATFDIGNFDAAHSFTTNFEIRLLADTDNSLTYSYSDRVTTGVSIVANPTPASGAWQTWTYTFTIDNATLNAAGGSVIGANLGFLIISSVPDGSGYAFDNLTISFDPVPEPAVASLLLGAGVLFLARRRGTRK